MNLLYNVHASIDFLIITECSSRILLHGGFIINDMILELLISIALGCYCIENIQNLNLIPKTS